MIAARTSLLALCAASLLGLASCGDDDEAAGGPASFAPADAVIYIEAQLRPSDEQQANVEVLLGRLGSLPVIGPIASPEDLIAQIIDGAAADEGVDVSFAEDIEPWLGDRASLAITDVDSADDQGFSFALEVTDETLAMDSIERLLTADGSEVEDVELGGVTGIRPAGEEGAVGVTDDTLVFAPTDADFEAAVDASEGDSLEDSADLDDALEPLEDDRLASLWVDFDAVAAASGTDEGELQIARGIFPELFDSPIVAGLSATAEAAILDVGLSGTAPAESELLTSAPADAAAAVAVAEVGTLARDGIARVEAVGTELGEIPEGGLDQAFSELTGISLDDAAASLGDAVVYGRGELPDAGSATLEAALLDGGDAAQAMLDGLSGYFETLPRTRVGPPLGSGTGFSAENLAGESAGFVNAEADEETLTLTFAGSRAEAEDQPGAGALADDVDFQAAETALGDEFGTLGFARAGELLAPFVGSASVLDAVTGSASPEEAALSLVADRLSFVGVGAGGEDDRFLARLALGVR